MIGKDDDIIDLYYYTHKVTPRGSRTVETMKAWSFDKDLAKAYGKFHNSDNLKYKTHTGTVAEIAELLENFTPCEIKLARLKTRNPENSKKIIWVYAPVTDEEMNPIKAHLSSACTDMVHEYRQLQDMFYKLKDEYQNALRALLFEEIMRKANSRPSSLAERIHWDEVRLLYYDNPTDFGE